LWNNVVPISVYGIQHYVSMLGSLVLIPLVIVPAMGGSHVSDFLTCLVGFCVLYMAKLLLLCV
jgi:nucleobase transporter 1/2